MGEVSAFIEALSERWWAVVGSGAFTFLGIFVAITGKTHRWTIYASFAMAVVMVVIAAYRAWNDERNRYLAELSKIPSQKSVASTSTKAAFTTKVARRSSDFVCPYVINATSPQQ